METGFFFGADRSTHGEVRADSAARSRQLLAIYDRFPPDVLNLSSHDLAYFSRILNTSESPNSSETVRRFISANVSQSVQRSSPVASHSLKVVNARGRDGSIQKIRVSFVGFTETSPVPPPGFRITDPHEAARRIIPAVRQNSDLVVVLFRASTAEAVKLARVPGIDAILVGNGEIFTAPLQIGKTFIAFTAFETRSQGELRVYRDASGNFTMRSRFISMDPGVPDDPVVFPLADEASKAADKEYKNLQTLMRSWFSKTTLAGFRGTHQNGFAGSGSCAQCHAKEYSIWTSSAHARASDRLIQKEIEFEVSCLKCHSTGADHRSLSESNLPQMQQVSCEACHGPGAAHVAKPDKGYGAVNADSVSCKRCHSSETSPGFTFGAAWTKIKH